MKRTAIHFEGPDFFLDKSDVHPRLLEALTDCGRPGPADLAVRFVRKNFGVSGDPIDCQRMLRGYGAWENNELHDHETNLDRLVWLTGCSLAEGEPAYFGTY